MYCLAIVDGMVVFATLHWGCQDWGAMVLGYDNGVGGHSSYHGRNQSLLMGSSHVCESCVATIDASGGPVPRPKFSLRVV